MYQIFICPDQKVLPVFKNYHPGKPSCRLYIKNLAKHVEMKDLDFIYKKYELPNIGDDNNPSPYEQILLIISARFFR